MTHIPVLQKEVIEYLDPKPNENFIDCTVGEVGHTALVLEKTKPNGKVLGIDQDIEQISNLKFQIPKLGLTNRLVPACENFVNLKKIVEKEKFINISGILFDLGMSSWHLEKGERGFSFQKKETLDMRYNSQNPLTAEKILNYYSVSEIERILKELGEEQFAGSIAKNIVEIRKFKPIQNTLELVAIIKKSTPAWYQHQKIHFATKTFQALRIAVNDELDNLKNALPQAIEILEPEGRLVVISFHSLEDRIVKNFYKEQLSLNKIKILTKKPISPKEEEIKINPRSRSAKLRAAKKI